eukprot:jgi/Hompol1/12/HPOL_002425-RA
MTAIRNPELACMAGGTKAMISALMDGPHELMDPIVSTLLFILDSPQHRSFLQPNVELESVIVQFAEAYTLKAGYSVEKLSASAAVLHRVLSSWTAGANKSFDKALKAQARPNLVVQFKAVLLTVVIEAGLIDSLPSLFKLASNFQNESQRHAATSRLAQIISRGAHGADAESSQSNQQGLISELDSIKAQISFDIDDLMLKTMINESEVMGVKDISKWDWNIIDQIVSGPLLNSKRFPELVRNTRFASRLVTYFRASSHQFSDLRLQDESSKRICDVGITFFRNLIANPDGVKFLAETKFMQDIFDHLSQFATAVGPPAENVFSKYCIDSQMGSAYFDFIHEFMDSKNGTRILEQNNIFSVFYQLADVRGRDDILNLMLKTLNHTSDGHARILLGKMLVSSAKSMRLKITQHMEYLADIYPDTFHQWGTALLATQLYDPSLEVVQAATHILETLCRSPDHLEAFVALNPEIQHLSIISRPLLIMTIGTTRGFARLLATGYIDSEVDYWLEYGNHQYVTQVELSLSEGLAAGKSLPLFESIDKDIVLTCFYALCLVCRCKRGAEILSQFGWSSEAACIPVDPLSILKLDGWLFTGSWPRQQRLTFKPIEYQLDDTEQEILRCIGNLSNHIIATAASQRLAAIRQQNPQYFVKPELCIQAWQICTVYHYRVATRRFIQELFNNTVFDSRGLAILDQMDGLKLSHPMQNALSDLSLDKSQASISTTGEGQSAPPRESTASAHHPQDATKGASQ